MRIVLLSPLPPARDGIADYSGRLAAAYTDAGHTVAAVTSTRQPDASGAPVLGALSFSPLSLARLALMLRRWKADAVQVQHGIATFGPRLLPLWLLVVLLRLTGTGVVLTHHEVTRDVQRLGLPARLYYGFVSRLAHVVHVHTTAARDVLVDTLHVDPDRVVVRPHPVYDLPPLAATGPQLRAAHGLSGTTVMLQFGFVHVEKGLRELVEGVAVLLARDPSLAARLRVVVAGDVRPRPAGFSRFEQADHDYLAAVRARVAEAGLADVVTFTGHVPDTEVAGWFQAADVVVLPYTHSEQSGVANLAIAAGVPVLASRTGGLGDLFAGALPTFSSLDPEGVADAVAAHLTQTLDRQTVAAHYAVLVAAGSPRMLAEDLAARLGVPVAVEVAA